MIQQDLVHLLGGLGSGEGGEAGCYPAESELLDRPQGLGGGAQQKGGPVFVLGCLDRPEVSRFGRVCHLSQGRGPVILDRSYCLMKFAANGGQTG